MDAHLRSIKGANAQKLGGVELHAHYVSRRYAEFTCSILLILHKGNKALRGEMVEDAVVNTPASTSSVAVKCTRICGTKGQRR